MRQLCDCKVLKILSQFLRISLAGLICTLCILDAPEYTRCTHIGICEFLEVCVDFTENRKLENMLETINHLPHRIFSAGRNIIGYFSCFLQQLKKIINNRDFIHENLIENQILIKGFSWPSAILPILYRCVNPFRHKVLCPSLRTMSKAFLKEEHIPPSNENNLPSSALQIVTISIIKS